MVECSIGCLGPVVLLIDSGSDWNVVTTDDWAKLKTARKNGSVVLYGIEENPLENAKVFASAVAIKPKRSFYAWVSVLGFNKPRNFAKFFVVEGTKRAILGRETATRMELLQVGVSVIASRVYQVEPGRHRPRRNPIGQSLCEYPGGVS